MNLEPYMVLDGVEIANNLRTLTYIRRGLSSAAWSVTFCAAGSSGPGYLDVYGDVYQLDSMDPASLGCFCHALYTGSSYDSPFYDPAPWYDAARPESNEFLGILARITLLPVAHRTLSPRANGRGDVGPLRVKPRIIRVEGAILAGSRAGMGYGERWLTAALSQSGAGCGDAVLTVLPYCPPATGSDDDTEYFRELHNVGIVDGPDFSMPVAHAATFYQEFAFQMAAGEPWLRRSEVAQALADFSVERCATIQADALMNSAAAVITINTGVGVLDGVTIDAWLGACPEPGGTPLITYTVDDLPSHSQLVIDASKETVSVVDAGGVITGSLNYLDFTGLFRWLVAQPGTSLCVCVDGTTATGISGATVSIDMVEMEL